MWIRSVSISLTLAMFKAPRSWMYKENWLQHWKRDPVGSSLLNGALSQKCPTLESKQNGFMAHRAFALLNIFSHASNLQRHRWSLLNQIIKVLKLLDPNNLQYIRA